MKEQVMMVVMRMRMIMKKKGKEKTIGTNKKGATPDLLARIAATPLPFFLLIKSLLSPLFPSVSGESLSLRADFASSPTELLNCCVKPGEA